MATLPAGGSQLHLYCLSQCNHTLALLPGRQLHADVPSGAQAVAVQILLSLVTLLLIQPALRRASHPTPLPGHRCWMWVARTASPTFRALRFRPPAGGSMWAPRAAWQVGIAWSRMLTRHAASRFVQRRFGLSCLRRLGLTAIESQRCSTPQLLAATPHVALPCFSMAQLKPNPFPPFPPAAAYDIDTMARRGFPAFELC